MKVNGNFGLIFFVFVLVAYSRSNCVEGAWWGGAGVARDFACFKGKCIRRTDLQEYMAKNISLPLVYFALTEKGAEVLQATPRASKIPSRIHRFIRFLNNIVNRYHVFKLEFVVDIGDGYTSATFSSPIPLFVFSKNRLCNDGLVLIPDTGSIEKGAELLKIVTACQQRIPFVRRINKLIWRGTTTGKGFYGYGEFVQNPRFKLVQLSIANRDLIDARFAHMGRAVPIEVRNYLIGNGFLGNFMPIEAHQRYKYQILVDGNTASWTRAYWELASDSLVFKQNSDNMQWYYHALEPYVHYVPVEADMSDLLAKLKWAGEQDQTAHQIVKRANKFVADYLNYDAMLCYMYEVLMAYSRVYKSN